MKDILFSISIPAYKKRFLKDAISSCLAQTYKNFEIIILDDASPEDLYSVVSEFNDERIRYYRNEVNCGAVDIVKNWNKCLEICKGQYLICMGDDDCLCPECLETYMSLIRSFPGLGLYHGWTEIIDEDSRTIDIQDPRPIWESAWSLAWNRWKYRDRQYIGDFLFSVEELRSRGGFFYLPCAWGADDISAISAAISTGVANTQKICFKYRDNNMSISRSSSNIMDKLAAIKMEREWFEDFIKIDTVDGNDRVYRGMLQNNIKLHYEKKFGQNISDASRNVFEPLKYFCKRRSLGFSFKSILYAMYLVAKR